MNFSVALRSRSFCGAKDSSYDVSGKRHIVCIFLRILRELCHEESAVLGQFIA